MLCNLGLKKSTKIFTGRCGRDLMVVGFTNTFPVSAYHHTSCGFEPRSWRGVLVIQHYVVKFISDVRQIQ